jgi:hypothetical protein
MSESNEVLKQIRLSHIEIESILQSIAARIPQNFCFKCTEVCCKEEICRESIESPFLNFILGDHKSNYSQTDGWLNKSTGCTTVIGRPLICYEFFCQQFDSNSVSSRLHQFAVSLKKIYSNAYKKQNILVVDDLSLIPLKKLKGILLKLNQLKVVISSYESQDE